MTSVCYGTQAADWDENVANTNPLIFVFPAMSGNRLLAMNMAVMVGETLLFGIVLVLFLANICIRSSCYQSTRDSTQPCWHPVFLIFTTLLLCCTAHWLLIVICFFRGVLRSMEAHTTLPFYELWSLSSAGIEIINFITICIGDAIIIYRLWIVWSRDLRITIPAVILWVAYIGIFYLHLNKSVSNILLVFGSVLQHRILVTFYQQDPRVEGVAIFIITLAINIYCTVLIAWRVWTKSRAKELLFVVSVLIDSAAIYTAWTLFAIISGELHSITQAVAGPLVTPIIGLTNMLIFLRVGFRPPACTRTQEESGIVLTTMGAESHEYRFPLPDPVADKSRVLQHSVSRAV
ncbi:hypothetical protein MVEN_01292800 [Mycena venus]|uniref:Uncharacterized protein n=1 Tax=Mycena venus TaxID=2733690 RepID=A0A8H6Y0G8_9AGAR|nr:hypothetical protein MVEN_01292800 [Mycena venus]